jgi:hypothetical protein
MSIHGPQTPAALRVLLNFNSFQDAPRTTAFAVLQTPIPYPPTLPKPPPSTSLHPASPPPTRPPPPCPPACSSVTSAVRPLPASLGVASEVKLANAGCQLPSARRHAGCGGGFGGWAGRGLEGRAAGAAGWVQVLAAPPPPP